MSVDIVIPEMGESVTNGVITSWLKADGEYVERDEPVLELETDKITMEVPAPVAGGVKHAAAEGDTVDVGAVVGSIDESVQPAAVAAGDAKGESEAAAEVPAPAAAAPAKTNGTPASTNGASAPAPKADAADVRATPLAKKIAEEHGVDLGAIRGTGAGGRVREHDVLASLQHGDGDAASGGGAAAPARQARREPMSRLRQRVAARLVEAQQTAAMLTTFNEVDMSAVMSLRKQYKEAFGEAHGVNLGFMSFFVAACAAALKRFPAVNASIVADDSGAPEIEYHDYCDVSIAVGTPKGLVVPVLRSAERLSFAEIESGIKDLATRARDGKLGLDELQGGTFTITNGGVYGSLMSTPILNPPQTAILGMHAIKNRAIEHPAGSGQMALRPMMYLAVSYDHRLIDGADAVQFLVAIKDAIEDPTRLLLGV